MTSCKLSEIFWSTFVGIVAGLLITITNQLFKSKCKEVSCCCIKIIRDIEAETQLELNNPIQSSEGHTGLRQQQTPTSPIGNKRVVRLNI